jgi:folate-dependent phosphoribosylglycinamide formyltransferase PurN
LRIAIAFSDDGNVAFGLAERMLAQCDRLNALGLIFPAGRSPPDGAIRTRLPSVELLEPRGSNVERTSSEFFRACQKLSANVIVLAHYLRQLRIPPGYEGRLISVHGSLLPAFGGFGRYGLALQREVLASGAKDTGCTVHIVTNVYDEGPKLIQRHCPVLQADDPSSLLRRIQELEVEALEAVLCGKEDSMAMWKEVGR